MSPDAARPLHLPDFDLRVRSSVGAGRWERGCESACVLPARRSTPLCDIDASGGDASRGGIRKDDIDWRSLHLPAVSGTGRDVCGAGSCIGSKLSQRGGCRGDVAHRRWRTRGNLLRDARHARRSRTSTSRPELTSPFQILHFSRAALARALAALSCAVQRLRVWVDDRNGFSGPSSAFSALASLDPIKEVRFDSPVCCLSRTGGRVLPARASDRIWHCARRGA